MDKNELNFLTIFHPSCIAIHPSEMIKDLIHNRLLQIDTIVYFDRIINNITGRKSTLISFFNKESPMTDVLASYFSNCFGISKEYFYNLQTMYNLATNIQHYITDTNK